MTTVKLTQDIANHLNKLYWIEHDMYQAASSDSIKEWVAKTFSAIYIDNRTNNIHQLEFNNEKDATMFLLKVA